jgi:sRNA-binding carbon storage regulator CsrA
MLVLRLTNNDLVLLHKSSLLDYTSILTPDTMNIAMRVILTGDRQIALAFIAPKSTPIYREEIVGWNAPENSRYDDSPGKLILSRLPGQAILIDDGGIKIRYLEADYSGNMVCRVKMGFEAPEYINFVRGSLLEMEVQQEWMRRFQEPTL